MNITLSLPLRLTGTTLSIDVATGTTPGLLTAAQFLVLAGLGTASTQATGFFATAAQGAKADSALQNATAFATAAQGVKADSALQPGGTGTVAADTGWTANADAGDKTSVIGSTATLDTIATALNIVTAGAGTQLENIAQKVKAIEAALALAKRPNA